MPELSVEDYALQHIVWTGPDSSVTIPIPGNVDKYRFLDIDMAIDSTDAKNKKGQSMILIFHDASGNTAQYTVESDAAAMLWQEGELLTQMDWEGKTGQEYSTFTPLVTLRLDLSRINQIDLSRLTSVEMFWGASTGGSLMLRSISAIA